MESHGSQQDRDPIESQPSYIYFLDSPPSKAIDEDPSQKRREKQGREETSDAVSFLKKKKLVDNNNTEGLISEDNGLDLELRIGLPASNASLNFDDPEDHDSHAFDFIFPVNNPEVSLNNNVFGYGSRGELKEPSMEENNIHTDLHAGLSEDNGLDLELRLGVSSLEDPDPTLKLF